MKEVRDLINDVISSLFASMLFFMSIAIASTKILSDELELNKLVTAISEIYTFTHFIYMTLALIFIFGTLIISQRIASKYNLGTKIIDKTLELAAYEFHKNTIHFGGVLTGISIIATYLAFSLSDCKKTIAFLTTSILLFISFTLYGFISKSILNSNI